MSIIFKENDNFFLLKGDNKQDKMLMATDLLHKRLISISGIRNSKKLDPTPLLADIEKTHIFNIYATYKPFVALTFEYLKVKPTKKYYNLGEKVEFSIPTFGDFFGDMVVHAKLTMNSDSYIPFNTVIGHKEKGTWDDLLSYNNHSPKWHWCNYPGERLLESVEFSLNGATLDSYTSFTANIWREFYVQPNKKRGWDKCMGQEIEEKGFFGINSVNSKVNKNINNNDTFFSQNEFFSTGCRLNIGCTDGLQTPAYCHEKEVELWIPLLFWFNTDFKLSIPSVAFPYGHRFIELKLANLNKLIGFEINNSNVSPYFSGKYSKFNFSKPINGCEFLNNKLMNIELTLYVNNLFINPEIHEIFIRHIGFNLIRVHKEKTFILEKPKGTICLNSSKLPIETLYIGAHYVDINSKNPLLYPLLLEQWNTYTYNSYYQYIKPIIGNNNQINFDFAKNIIGDKQSAIKIIKLDKQPIFKKLSILSYKIKHYENFPSDFFNKYIPYRFGGQNVNSPEDKGLLMINFSLIPHSYQPSGYTNISKSGELYLDYEVTDFIKKKINNSKNKNTHYKYSIVVLERAINFLLISDGVAILRYST